MRLLRRSAFVVLTGLLLSMVTLAGPAAKKADARARQKYQDEVEPFLNQAGEKFSEGEYAQSQQICDEILLRYPDDAPAKACVEKARAKLLEKPKAAPPVLKTIEPQPDRVDSKRSRGN